MSDFQEQLDDVNQQIDNTFKTEVPILIKSSGISFTAVFDNPSDSQPLYHHQLEASRPTLFVISTIFETLNLERQAILVINNKEWLIIDHFADDSGTVEVYLKLK